MVSSQFQKHTRKRAPEANSNAHPDGVISMPTTGYQRQAERLSNPNALRRQSRNSDGDGWVHPRRPWSGRMRPRADTNIRMPRQARWDERRSPGATPSRRSASGIITRSGSEEGSDAGVAAWVMRTDPHVPEGSRAEGIGAVRDGSARERTTPIGAAGGRSPIRSACTHPDGVISR